MKKFEERTAIITGAAGGIGRATVERFLSEGAIVHAIDAQEASFFDSSVACHRFDVSDEAAWERFASGVVGDQPTHALVNNAGVSGFRPFDKLSLEEWRRFQRINVEAALLSVKALYSSLRRADAAAVVNVGSLVGLRPVGALPAYASSKGALINLTKSMARDFAERRERIRCNIVHPGSVATDMMRANIGATEEEQAQNLQRRMEAHPYAKAMGGLPEPADIANAILFLASDEARFITGIDLPVDAGASI